MRASEPVGTVRGQTAHHNHKATGPFPACMFFIVYLGTQDVCFNRGASFVK
jgi:hypothetical protein